MDFTPAEAELIVLALEKRLIAIREDATGGPERAQLVAMIRRFNDYRAR